MIPRKMRLSRAHFAPQGPETRAASTHFSLSTWEAPQRGGLAAVISKKVARLSVSRHLLKRRILAAALPFGSTDRAVVIYARPNAASLPYSELKSELTELLARVIK